MGIPLVTSTTRVRVERSSISFNLMFSFDTTYMSWFRCVSQFLCLVVRCFQISFVGQCLPLVCFVYIRCHRYRLSLPQDLSEVRVDSGETGASTVAVPEGWVGVVVLWVVVARRKSVLAHFRFASLCPLPSPLKKTSTSSGYLPLTLMLSESFLSKGIYLLRKITVRGKKKIKKKVFKKGK